MFQPEDFDRSWASPPTSNQVHAPTVAAIRGGLAVAWFEGSHEGASDTRIYLARNVGEGWQAPMVVHPEATPHWNPVLTRTPAGELWLYFKRGEKISEWRTWVSVSHDEGLTWSPARPLVDGPAGNGGRGPVKNPPIYLGNTWLAPGSVETWANEPRWDAFIDVSSDDGQTWQKAAIPLDHSSLTGAGVIQPALWASAEGGVLHALMRSSEGQAFLSTSADQGETWTPAQPTSLPNNNSGLAALALEPGIVIAVHNPVAGDWAPRCPLALAVSWDDGLTWDQVGVVEDGVTPLDDDPAHQPIRPEPADAPQGGDGGVTTTGRGEYSYPSMIFDGERLTICYSWQRRRIVCAQISPHHLIHMSPLDKKAL